MRRDQPLTWVAYVHQTRAFRRALLYVADWWLKEMEEPAMAEIGELMDEFRRMGLEAGWVAVPPQVFLRRLTQQRWPVRFGRTDLRRVGVGG